MNKQEMIEFLENQRELAEDALYKLGAIEDVTVDAETKNNIIQDSFSDIVLLLKSGNIEEAIKHAEGWSEKQWL